MPHADYEEWARSSPARFQDRKKVGYGESGADFSRVGSRAVPVWLAVSLPIR
jgi:hypothetical protein